MKKISPLQIGIYVVFAIAIIFGLLIFSGKLPIGQGSSTSYKGTVTMWGTLPSEGIGMASAVVANYYPDLKLNYVRKESAVFQSDLVNALASGTGPDLIAVTSSDIVQNYPRLLTIPFTSLSQDSFKSSFIDQGSQYLKSDGTLALPFVVDPIVMYYNNDLLASVFVTTAPKTWDDVVALNKKITVRDDTGKLLTQTIAMGTYANILHAKELIVMLSQQAGNPLVSWDDEKQQYVSRFADVDRYGTSGIVNALGFFTAFSNPADVAHYSWDASLPMDRDQFISGKLGLYFGYASEAETLRKKNPNLNFGVGLVPSQNGATSRTTYGTMTGIAVIKRSANPTQAIAMAQTLINKDVIAGFLSINAQYAPARKDMLVDSVESALKTTISRSAIISKSFLDPDPVQTNVLFKKYIDQINSGQATPDQILTPGESLLKSILEKIQAQAAPAQ